MIAGNAGERGVKRRAHALRADDVLVDLERARRLAADHDGVGEPLRQLVGEHHLGGNAVVSHTGDAHQRGEHVPKTGSLAAPLELVKCTSNAKSGSNATVCRHSVSQGHDGVSSSKCVLP